jgi:hypothetical protein
MWKIRKNMNARKLPMRSKSRKAFTGMTMHRRMGKTVTKIHC